VDPTSGTERPAGLVLAGGRGRRLGGADKGLVPVDGEPMALRAARLLRRVAGPVAVSANRNPERYAALGLPVLEDGSHGGRGPLAGVLRGLEWCPAPWLLVLPCDTPRLPPAAVEALWSRARRGDVDAVVLEAGGRLHPLHCALRAGLRGRLAAWLEGGGRAATDWMRALGAAVVRLGTPEAALNVNTPDDLERARGGRPPVLVVTGWSGAGKTTLLERLLAALCARGLRVGAVKHTHHDVELDRPGKDSHRLRAAGARQVLLATPRRRFLVTELGRPTEPGLEDLVGALDRSLDLVLAEGFKGAPFPKLEVHRPACGRPLLAAADPDIIAVAADGPVAPAPSVPVLDLNDTQAIVRFVLAACALDGITTTGETAP